MAQHFDVLVAGGGIVGLTAALAMAQRHHTVAIMDGSSLQAHPSARVYAINKASRMLLNQLGVWQCLDAKRLSPYHQMHVWDATNGAYIDFDSRLIAASNLGYIVEESIIKKALLEQIGAMDNISLFPHCAIDKIESSDTGIKIFSQDKVWAGNLLMVADGANSPARKKLNVELASWAYHQNALVATVQTEKTHASTAYQVFNTSGPLAFLPLTNPHQCSIVWSTTPDHAETLMVLEEKQFNEELTRFFGKQLGQIKLIGSRHQFPLQMRHVKQYSGKNWLLLGDAAHTIHPLAGLGLNVGLADISTWLKYADQNKRVIFTPATLAAYQRERKHAVWQVILLMEGFKRLFASTAAPVSTMRGLGLRVCNRFNSIKRLFIEHAAG